MVSKGAGSDAGCPADLGPGGGMPLPAYPDGEA